MTPQKGYHCAYGTHYHIVFPVKYRKALLSDDVTKTIKEISKGLEERYDLTIEQVGCDSDHIHLLVSIHPKYSIGQFVRLYKSITAKQVFLKFPEVKKDLWGGEFWTDGYYVATVGEKANWSIVERYVKNQWKHDEKPPTLW
ncbi:MAG: transposase [Candidatus Yonathbacteria bacterium RIFCSPHIGHO2_01_FULL_44_41]|uniref:Transposase n=1 Tax=Candidatus Yonathbacteria bacterium RIFCSPHIGHO2_02_FULL_44_14 TaxID=1802724 RepID=A0A1G2SAD6_9BACT|nr:MAG: transposase [Candidatus Yonathbacteria bacterium RIFCSPHIGHO2_01_FULL_44_41]OHA80781.1 MAG: transposase [Candidatus Yonathbacteria bacterium RIFCSPLOWO2_01_FULL_43_20]OHA82014.1 MAG: transposase [Candidatus Yonathbacteria bacterium RIFCSPHIGHO2_02_FULL_44_14]